MNKEKIMDFILKKGLRGTVSEDSGLAKDFDAYAGQKVVVSEVYPPESNEPTECDVYFVDDSFLDGTKLEFLKGSPMTLSKGEIIPE